MDSAQVVRRFEHEFKNNANHGTVVEVMSEDFVYHLPCRGLPPGRAGMRARGGARHRRDPWHSRRDPAHSRPRRSSRQPGERQTGVRAGTGAPLTWAENHIYQVTGGQITELWPAGGPQPG